MKKAMILMMVCLSIVILTACTTVPTSAPVDPNSITGIVWKWQKVTDKSSGADTKVPNPDVYTIIFHEAGTTEGQADCNTFSGTYSQEGGFTITVQPDVMAACDQGSLDQQIARHR